MRHTQLRTKDKPEPIELSILMPAHMASKTIAMAVISTLVVMPRKSELLIHLDGPGTNSRVLTWAKDLRCVRVFESSEVLGISGALNNLIDKSRGEFIARMDADDISLPFRFRKARKLVHTKKADLVFSNAILFGADLKFPFLVPQFPYSLSAEASKLMLGLANPFVHPTLFARKSSLTQVGGYKDCVAEDYNLWMSCQISGRKILRDNSFGVLYRIHKGQYTRREDFLRRQLEDPVLAASKEAYNSYLAGELGISRIDSQLALELDRQLKSMSLGYRLRYGGFRTLIEKVLHRTPRLLARPGQGDSITNDTHKE